MNSGGDFSVIMRRKSEDAPGQNKETASNSTDKTNKVEKLDKPALNSGEKSQIEQNKGDKEKDQKAGPNSLNNSEKT